MNRPARTGGARRNAWCGAIRERRDFLTSVVGVLRQGREFVTYAHVYRKIRAYTPIVLDVPCEETLADGDLIAMSGSERVQLDGCVV